MITMMKRKGLIGFLALFTMGGLLSHLQADIPRYGKSDYGKTYAQLAQKHVKHSYDSLVRLLEDFNDDTQPHEAKRLRRQIGVVRAFLDLFVYAFPTNIQGDDLWKSIRKKLNQGYTDVGDFKDLFDMQGVSERYARYSDQAEVAFNRTKVQRWKRRFLSGSNQRKFRNLVASAQTRMVDRPKSELSRFFWGAVDAKPSASNKGIENLALLVRGLLRRSIEEYSSVRMIPDLLNHDNAEKFHDFRKRTRTSLNTIRTFPGIARQRNKAIHDSFDDLSSLVDRYGALNDKLTAHHYFAELGDQDKTSQFAQAIPGIHSQLNQWQDLKQPKLLIQTLLSAFDRR